jgi:uncharacterized membrane protein YdjX (TVP38/TMEM64 family)
MSSAVAPPLCAVRQIVFCAFVLALAIFVIAEYSDILSWLGDLFAFLLYQSIIGKSYLIVLILIGIDLIAIPCFIPSAIFALGSGYVFGSIYGQWIGWLIASGTTFAGVYAGSLLAFAIGRWMLRGFVERLDLRSETWKCIDIVVARKGSKLVALTKLCALTPWNVFNYLISSTAIEFKQFMIGNICILPTILVECFVGTSLSSVFQVSISSSGTVSISVSEISGKVYWIYIGTASVISLALLIWIAIVSRREVRTMLEQHSTLEIPLSTVDLRNSNNEESFISAPA